MTTVPSNLIPVRVTQLPLAPVADENSLLFIVYQGKNYQIRAGDLLSVAGVPVTRQVIAGTGMAGGGQLSSNVTLSIAPGGVGSTELANSGVTPGIYGNSTDIPVFTVDNKGRVVAATTIPATISGYVPDTRQVIAGTGLTGGGALSSNVTLAANLSNSTPLAVFQSGDAGVSTGIARADHKHPAVNLSNDDEVDGLLGLGNGGTGRSISASPGTIVWCGADGLYLTSVGAPGQVLISGGTGAPGWANSLVISDQPANVVYAGPSSGPAAPTTFRSLVTDDLPNSGVAAATYGGATIVPVFTVNSKGQITSVSNTAIAIDASQISTGVVGVARGGTGLSTTPTNGQIDIGNGSGFTRATLTQSSGISITNGAGSVTIANSGVLSFSGGTTGLTPSVLTTGAVTLGGTLGVANGGSGTTTLTGYLRGNGTSAFTGSASIPNTDITGLGTMSTQSASSVAITGGAVNGTTIGATTPAAGTFTSVGMTSGTITTAPSSGNDIVNKTYADSIASGINFHQSCRLATTGALPSCTYNNGVSGVGATLTATANGALSVDTTAVVSTNRILVKNQVNTAHNGVYVVTQTGDAGSPFILTRATDFDSAGTGVDQIDQGDFFLITSGSTLANTSWVQQTPLPVTVGTTGIVFSQFGAPLTYTAGTGLNESPAYTFNIANTGVVSGSYGGAATAITLSVNARGQITSASDATIAIAATQVTSGTLDTARLSGSYTGITGVGTLTAGTWSATAIAATRGGTGLTSYTQGDLLYASSSSTIAALSDVATGNALISGGVGADPSWGKIGLTTHVSGVLPVANGGTNGTTAPTAGAVAYGTGTAYAFSLAGSSNQVLLSGGTGVPTWANQSSLSVGSAATATTATSATSATTATNLAGGAASQIPYQTGAGATAFLANGVSGQVLRSAGSSAPVWANVDGGTF